jgi:hypothetical protein
MKPARPPVVLRHPLHSRFDIGQASFRIYVACFQLVILLLELFYCLLLFFDCIEHGPHDEIIIDQQIALLVLLTASGMIFWAPKPMCTPLDLMPSALSGLYS